MSPTIVAKIVIESIMVTPAKDKRLWRRNELGDGERRGLGGQQIYLGGGRSQGAGGYSSLEGAELLQRYMAMITIS